MIPTLFISPASVMGSFLQQPLRQHDIDALRHRLLAVPVALELAGEGNPPDRHAPGLNDTLDACAVSLHRRAADGVDNGIDLIALPQRVQGRERHADLGPKRTE